MNSWKTHGQFSQADFEQLQHANIGDLFIAPYTPLHACVCRAQFVPMHSEEPRAFVAVQVVACNAASGEPGWVPIGHEERLPARTLAWFVEQAAPIPFRLRGSGDAQYFQMIITDGALRPPAPANFCAIVDDSESRARRFWRQLLSGMPFRNPRSAPPPLPARTDERPDEGEPGECAGGFLDSIDLSRPELMSRL